MKEINIRDVKENAVKLIADDWALLTAADGEKGCNPMTVSWGGIGELWGRDTATVYVRRSRYTKQLMDKELYFSLCFFDKSHRDALSFCGSHSGRDVDKVKETGLTPVYDEKAPYFKEASMSGLILQFAFNYTDNNRPKLSSFETMPELSAYLDKQNTVDKFATYADKNGLKRRNLLIRKSYNLLKLFINSRIIYNIMDEEDWIEYLNLDDNVIKTAIDVFENNAAFPKKPEKQKN